MTVTYTKKVTNTSFCGFSKLLFSTAWGPYRRALEANFSIQILEKWHSPCTCFPYRWRGSVFKLVWPDLLVYFLMYSTCSIVYRFALNDSEKRIFEKIAISCEYFRNVFPISFVLGFYVTIVVQRWWAQYMLIPWPDTVCIMASSYIQGLDERGRLLRKSFARFINLAFALAFRRISPRVGRRYATYQQLIDAGYMTEGEKVAFEMMDKHSMHHKIWMPLVWACMTAVRARKEGRCLDDYGLKAIIKEVTNLRYNCGKLQEYHTMSVPLVYTQVVTMATYSYFGFSILGRQFLDPTQGYDNHTIDFYVPIFTFLQFIFYMGWLKVAESLLNPFGDDDDDFDTNDFLDRHLEVSYMIVDVMHKSYPEVLQESPKVDMADFELATNTFDDSFSSESHVNRVNVNNISSRNDKFPPVLKNYMEREGCVDPRELLHRTPASLPLRMERSLCTPHYNRVSVSVDTRDGASHTTRLYMPSKMDLSWRGARDHQDGDLHTDSLASPRARPYHYSNGGFHVK